MSICIEGLTKTFPGGVTALDHADLSIGTGMFGLLGPGGAGKTTLMRILCTQLAPTSGRVTIGGVDLLREPQRIRQMTGYLPQEFGLFKQLNACEFLDLVGSLKGLGARERAAQTARLLERVNLAQHRHKPLGSYSGGMKRRLGIAQALMGDPRVLVVDEPTAGLDPDERLRFRSLLTELGEERIVLLSTHIVSDVESACGALAILDHGRVVFRGSPAALAEAARGRVWQLEVEPPDYGRLQQCLRMISAKRTEAGAKLLLRVLHPENPLGLGRPVAPTVEDGYLTVVAPSGLHAGEVPA